MSFNLAEYHAPGAMRTTPYGPLQWLDTGVLGVTETLPGVIVIWWVEAVYPGKGHVGRWLNRLPREKSVIVFDVISGPLAGMLQRRGFTKDPESNDWLREGSAA